MNQYHLTEEDVEKLHKCELEILVEIDRICRKYDIKYSIDGGTLLGAIRHGGFIPWDDDADVIMVRSEYEKFRKLCNQELDSSKFYLQDMRNTPGYRWGYAKLRRKNTQFIRKNQEHMPYEQGIFTDIFVCDNVPEKYEIRALCNFCGYIYRKLFWSEVGQYTSKGLTRLMYKIMAKIPEKRLKNSLYRYINYRNKHKSDWVKCITFPACNHEYGYKRKWYTDTIDIKFEDVVLKGSRDYNEYLCFLYGDYMKFPPEQKRKIHPVTTFEVN